MSWKSYKKMYLLQGNYYENGNPKRLVSLYKTYVMSIGRGKKEILMESRGGASVTISRFIELINRKTVIEYLKSGSMARALYQVA